MNRLSYDVAFDYFGVPRPPGFAIMTVEGAGPSPAGRSFDSQRPPTHD